MATKQNFSHSVLEEIKIPVVLDGDLAASICNAFTFADQQDAWGEVAFCEHAFPKINALVEKLAAEIDIETRPEK